MEPSSSWTRLEAALAAVGLEDLDAAWRFLVDQGLITNRATARDRLARAFEALRLEGASADPSAPSRVARWLRATDGTVTVAATAPDPDGHAMRAALEDFRVRDPELAPLIEAPFDEVHCQHCGALTSIRHADIERCQQCGEPPLDLVALAVTLGLSSATVRCCARCATVSSLMASRCYFCGASL